MTLHTKHDTRPNHSRARIRVAFPAATTLAAFGAALLLSSCAKGPGAGAGQRKMPPVPVELPAGAAGLAGVGGGGGWGRRGQRAISTDAVAGAPSPTGWLCRLPAPTHGSDMAASPAERVESATSTARRAELPPGGMVTTSSPVLAETWKPGRSGDENRAISRPPSEHSAYASP